MRKRRDPRQRAVVALLHDLRRSHALARNALVRQAARNAAGTAAGAGRPEQFAAQLPALVDGLIAELGGESGLQRRRFDVLRRSDVAREEHDAIALDMGLSRSQFYRDLGEAREQFAHVFEERLGSGVSAAAAKRGVRPDEARLFAIEALRNAGQHARARQVAAAVARDAAGATAIRALCLRAELETEAGAFDAVCRSVREARARLASLNDGQQTALLAATCDLVEFEAGHCAGVPASRMQRDKLLGRLRRAYDAGDGEYAPLLVKAAIGEASLLFAQDDPNRALDAIEEAAALVSREGLDQTRLAVDVKIRESGIAALRAERVMTALDQTADIVELGRRTGDVGTLRVGMQMMSAHLLTLGRLDEARHYALEARALIDLFGSELDRVIVLSNLARIDLHRGDGAGALRWISLARESPCDAFSITQALAISEAEALVLVRDPGQGASLARDLAARVRDWPRLQARAKLAEATALVELGREPEARECSDAALELSRGTGGPLLQLRALQLNVRLTSSPGARTALRELQAALGTPA